MLNYAIFLTFYNNIFLTISLGILLQTIVLGFYYPVLKEIYFKVLKKRGDDTNS